MIGFCNAFKDKKDRWRQEKEIVKLNIFAWESDGFAVPENIRSLVSFLLIASSISFDGKKLGNADSLRTEVNGLPLLNFKGSTRLHL